MKRIFLTTLFAALLGLLIIAMLLLFKGETFGTILYMGFLIIGSSIVPVLIAVLLFQIVRRQINFKNQTKTLILRILILILIFALGLIVWSFIDVIIYNAGFSDLALQNVIEDFESQFLGFIPATLPVAIAIPAIDILIEEKLKL